MAAIIQTLRSRADFDTDHSLVCRGCVSSPRALIAPSQEDPFIDTARLLLSGPRERFAETMKNVLENYPTDSTTARWNYIRFRRFWDAKEKKPTSGKKSHSRRHILRINGKDARVCKDFFISTFDISQSTATTFMTKKRKGPDTVADLRRKQRSSNKIPDAILRLMREHILSQTGPQGRLDQASSADGIQNVQKLYNHYHSECQDKGNVICEQPCDHQKQNVYSQRGRIFATAVEKTRNGSDSIIDMRGRHKPDSKTPEETLQNILELIIYLTGFRPHKLANNLMLKLKLELTDVYHLYQIYRYDC
ncbi:hypothetical protein RRG08_008589 [Elysia crispata]|uniref:Uncharacterized protein n=1 Tax=Elysia crispata TaxID=231223 RepID=A0AAE1EAU8_9GAST|nr:hypothetical protein RRG08_008589 [Elysia crispata]